MVLSVNLHYGVSQCYGIIPCYGVSCCYGVSPYYGVTPCYGVNCVTVFSVNPFFVLAHVIVLAAFWCYLLTLIMVLARVCYGVVCCYGFSLYYGVNPCHGVICQPSLWC